MASPHRTAGIIAIGDELILGQTLDTNSRWIGEALVERGVRPIEHVTVDDDDVAIASAIKRLVERCDLVVCTGGLGPTEDDRTRRALAGVLGEELIEDGELLAVLRAWYGRRAREMPETNRVQALRPPSATGLRNDNGTAPGLHAVVSGAVSGVGSGVDVFCLPGPPREMRPMLERDVVGALRVDPQSGVIRTVMLHTTGLGESAVAQRLGELMDRGRMPLVGTTASAGVVTCRVRYEGSAAGADGALRETVGAVRARLGTVVFGDGDQTLAGACLDLLRERGETACTIESCTGGLLGQMLTAVVGSSDAYVGGWVTYTNEMKHAQVGVERGVFERVGAVSGECALAMARGGLERSRAAHAVSITGIAGPGGGSAQKPVGTVWIGRASADGSAEARRFLFQGDRENARAWSAVSALAMLRLWLIGEEMELLAEVERVEGDRGGD